VRWPTPRAEVDISKLKVFHHFPSIDLLFCPTCSSPMFFADRRDKDRLLGVFTGVLTNIPADLIKYDNHIFLDETRDAGASIWLRHNSDGSEAKRFKFDDQKDPEELPRDWPPASSLTGYEEKKDDAVPIRCKCKGVDFVLHRGDYSEIPKDKIPFNVDPETHKLMAEFCVCDSCRLQSGVDIPTWTFTEMKHVSYGKTDDNFPTSTASLKKLADAKEPLLGTLTYYSSSPGVEWYFCSNCSATIFHAWKNRPNMLNVAIGVLEASDGARAEGFLSWPFGAKLCFKEDGKGGWREGLFERAERDVEEYRLARGYPKNWEKREAPDESTESD